MTKQELRDQVNDLKGLLLEIEDTLKKGDVQEVQEMIRGFWEVEKVRAYGEDVSPGGKASILKTPGAIAILGGGAIATYAFLPALFVRYTWWGDERAQAERFFVTLGLVILVAGILYVMDRSRQSK